MGHHNPKHLMTDLRAIRELQLDKEILYMQENDFIHFPGKINFTPQLAHSKGFAHWRSFGVRSIFLAVDAPATLLNNPDCFQVGIDGSHRAAGCYNNPKAVQHIQTLIEYTVSSAAMSATLSMSRHHCASVTALPVVPSMKQPLAVNGHSSRADPRSLPPALRDRLCACHC